MDEEMNAQDTPESGLGRRDVLKRGAIGAGVMGVVWASPVIEGLSLRPDYAAAASGRQGNPHCTADYKSDQVLGCVKEGAGTDGNVGSDTHPASTGHQDAIIPGNCGALHITIDQHWANIGHQRRQTNLGCNPQNGTPNGGAGGADFSCDAADVTVADANGQNRLVTIKRAAGNANCLFHDVKFDGKLSRIGGVFATNPKTGNHGTGASETGDQLQVLFQNDPNYRGDLGRPNGCGGKAHIHIQCT